MRRSLSLLLAVVVMVVSMLPLGCGENMAAKESREARADFVRVVGMVKEIQEGFLRTEKGLAALGTHKPSLIAFDDDAIVAAMKSQDHRAYKAAVIEQVEGKLKGLLDRGQTTQRVAAHQLLSSLYVASAAYQRREAMIVSNALSPQAAAIETFLSSIERTSGLIGVFTDDEAPVLEKWSQNQEAVKAAVAKFKADAQTLETEISDLQTQIDALATKRDEFFRQASALRADAFTKKGTQEYELHIKAIDAEREGQASDTKIDELTVTQDLAKAKQVILQRELSIAEKWSQLLSTGVDDVEKRQDEMKKLESAIVRDRAESAANLEGQLKQLTEAYDLKVTAKLDKALKKVNTAIETLKKADALARGEDKTSVKFNLLDAHLAKLAAEADAVVATDRFVTVGSQVISRTGQTPTGNVSELKAKVDEAKARRATMAGASVATVGAINGLLGDPVISSIKEGSELGDARIARIKAARTLADSHLSRVRAYDQGEMHGEVETQPTPDAPTPDAPDAGN